MAKKNRQYPSLRMRLMTVLVAFALIPTIASGVLLQWSLGRDQREQSARDIRQALGRVATDLRLLTVAAENTADALASDKLLRETGGNLAAGGLSLGAEIDTYRDITDRLLLANLNGQFHNIRVFLPDSELLTRESISLFGLSALADQVLPEGFASEQRNAGWADLYTVQRLYRVPPDTIDILSYYQRSTYTHEQGRPVVAVDLSAAYIRALFSDIGFAGAFSIIDPLGETVLRTAVGGWPQAQALTVFESEAGLWTVVAEVPMAQFNDGNATILLVVLGTVLVGGLLVPVISTLMARQLSAGIVSLASASERSGEGEYLPVAVDGSTREVRRLQEAYNESMRRIDSLIHDVYEARIAQQETQMKSLFEQLKPHFLYNTLECGKWLALKNNDEPTAIFLEKLAQLFRLSLSQGGDVVPLEQELRHIALYIDMMVYRTGHSVAYHQAVDEALLDTPVLRLLLQPLVENAIEHGILQSQAQTGTVTIRARRDGERIELCVEDDGVGMDPACYGALAEDSCAGYGTENVLRRLRLYYGDACEMRYEPAQPRGTRVLLRFPIETKQIAQC